MENKLDWKTFENKLGGWARYFKDFVEGEKMWNIYKKLKEWSKSIEQGGEGRLILPSSNLTFKAFEKCHPDKLKLIMYLADPYVGRYKDGSSQATGIPMCCSHSKEGKLQPSSLSFWEGVSNEYNEELEHFKTHDLNFLPEQGVLMLNRTLTAEYQKIGKHMGLWDDFHQFLLEDVIQSFYPGIPILFIGKDAVKLKKWVFEMSNPVFILDHPSFAARTGQVWQTHNTFHKINDIIKGNNNEEIAWSYKDFELLKEDIPF